MKFNLVYKPYGQHGILVEWPACIDEKILADVLLFKSKLAATHAGNIVESRSAYHSLLVIYSQFEKDFDDEVVRLKAIYISQKKGEKLKSTLWHIPVCYDAQFALDLKTISKSKNLSETEIIKRHSETIYTVFFIGFLPGFLYLGGLDERLATPRRATPRLQIEKGAVAIGGHQTGVYPNDSPGGWNIIGNSPVNFFNVKAEKPCFATAGDRIKFYPIDLKEHQNIKTLVDARVFQIESEVFND